MQTYKRIPDARHQLSLGLLGILPVALLGYSATQATPRRRLAHVGADGRQKSSTQARRGPAGIGVCTAVLSMRPETAGSQSPPPSYVGYVGQQKQVAKTTHSEHTNTNKEPP